MANCIVFLYSGIFITEMLYYIENPVWERPGRRNKKRKTVFLQHASALLIRRVKYFLNILNT